MESCPIGLPLGGKRGRINQFQFNCLLGLVYTRTYPFYHTQYLVFNFFLTKERMINDFFGVFSVDHNHEITISGL